MVLNREYVQTFKLDLYPEYTATVGLFVDVKNTPEIRSSLLSGKLNCALLNTEIIADVFSLLQACNKAVYSDTNKTMKTRNLHTEILFNLSPSNSIKESLTNFGASDSQTNLIGVCLRKHDDVTDGMETLLKMVDGATTKPLCDIEKYNDVDRIAKLYKVGKEELSIGSLADAVVLRVATKDAL